MNTSSRMPKIDHATRSIVVTAAFNHAAAIFGTKECDLLMKIYAAFPGYSVVENTTKRKSIKKKVKLTYDKMGKYISCLRNGAEYLEIFEKVKAFAASQPGAYFMVSNWFYASFPDYGCVPEFDGEGFPLVETNIISFEDYKERHDAAQQKQSKIEQLSATSEREQSEDEQREAI